MEKVRANLPHGGGKTNHPDTIVIHCMGEYIKDAGKTHHAVQFLNQYGLSAHSLVAPDGTNYRCRDDDQIAWHARGHNTGSLGLEMLVEGDHDYSSFIERIKTPYVTKVQYDAVVAQVREWIDLHSIKRIVRHSDLSPGRKADPGTGFPWQQFLEDVGMV